MQITLPATSRSKRARRIGFSLVELSIVLVILGLLVGGILSGQSLIRASELRTIVTQHDQFLAAIHSFKDKYFALPGDMTNATQFWGSANAWPGCALTNSTDQKTCDGDGDGQVVAITVAAPTRYESTRLWQHLANAGLIAGQFTGNPAAAKTYCAGGGATTSPAGKLRGSYWTSSTYDGVSWGDFAIDYGHIMALGVVGPTFCSTMLFPILTPAELWNIDSKMDDGKPAQGKVVVYAPANLDKCTDATGSYAAQSATLNANYLLSSNDTQCAITFRQQY